MEARLAEMGKRIDELKGRLGTVTGEVKAELERRIDAAYAGQEEQRQRLQQLKDQGWSSGTPLRTRPARPGTGLEKSIARPAARLNVTPGHVPGLTGPEWSPRPRRFLKVLGWTHLANSRPEPWAHPDGMKRQVAQAFRPVPGRPRAGILHKLQGTFPGSRA